MTMIATLWCWVQQRNSGWQREKNLDGVLRMEYSATNIFFKAVAQIFTVKHSFYCFNLILWFSVENCCLCYCWNFWNKLSIILLKLWNIVFCKTDTVYCFGVIIYITLFPMTLTCWQLYENMENVALVLVFPSSRGK